MMDIIAAVAMFLAAGAICIGAMVWGVERAHDAAMHHDLDEFDAMVEQAEAVREVHHE